MNSEPVPASSRHRTRISAGVAVQGFVKFFGQGSSRLPRDRPVFDAVKTSAYVEGRDVEDIARRPWLGRWPHFIRVEALKFVDGTLGDGVSLGELMDELGAYAFGATAVLDCPQ